MIEFTAAQQALMRRLAGLPEREPKRFRRPDPFSGVASMMVLDGLNYRNEIPAAVKKSVPMKCFERVSRLIELLQRANSLLQGGGGRSQRVIRELNSLSQRYKWSPAYRASETGLSLSWYFSDAGNWEDIAVWWIRQLVDNHRIHRLRRCSQCRTWFYAVTEHQRFCVEKCRKKYASKSPVFREQRRRYMADVYRPLKKKLANAALKMARANLKRNP